MNSKQIVLSTDQLISWFTEPEPNHLVHFYPFNDDLLNSLTEYFSQGLLSGETCIAVATPNHISKLNANLRAKGINLTEAIQSHQYIMLDANNTLADFMIDGLPEHGRFLEYIGRTISLAVGRGQPIRAFGEMVAILWERNNLKGLLQLEEYWHDLIEEQQFSLYCAYPKNLFDKSYSHKEAIDKICGCHSLALV